MGLLFFTTSVFALPDSRVPEDWYKRAKEDLDDAQMIFDKTDHYDQVCFLAHQAIEKSLKGALIHYGVEPERTHRTAQLASRLSNLGHKERRYHKYLRVLDQDYSASRYPKTGYSFTKDKASASLEIAQTIYADISSSERTIPVN